MEGCLHMPPTYETVVCRAQLALVPNCSIYSLLTQLDDMYQVAITLIYDMIMMENVTNNVFVTCHVCE